MIGRKKTKIVATLGPATEDPQVIKDMMAAGVNVFRINFSHADYDGCRVVVYHLADRCCCVVGCSFCVS